MTTSTPHKSLDTLARYWDRIHDQADPETRSWFQHRPSPSLELIVDGAPPPHPAVLDVGGGASTLPRHLLDAGYRRIGVLDVSGSALARARERLGADARDVVWIEGDVTQLESDERWNVWHDRAVLHFLTTSKQRASYHSRLLAALAPGGCAILGTFGPEGPERCSGLPCRRYDVRTLCDFIGERFALETHLFHQHQTPPGGTQQFLHARFRHRG